MKYRLVIAWAFIVAYMVGAWWLWHTDWLSDVSEGGPLSRFVVLVGLVVSLLAGVAPILMKMIGREDK